MRTDGKSEGYVDNEAERCADNLTKQDQEPVMFAVIFEVHPADGQRDAYLEHAKELKPELETIDGFVDNERFESRSKSGWVLSLSTWRDEKSVIRWRTQAKHHFTQEAGRSEIFSDYHLRVGEITADSHSPVPLREVRFDETETGASRLCTIVELTLHDGAAPSQHENALVQALGLVRGMPGLNDVEVFDSIYNADKILVLGSWIGPEVAAASRPTAFSDVVAFRYRAVRIIRDYGMFDRRETPQYYPDVKRRR